MTARSEKCSSDIVDLVQVLILFMSERDRPASALLIGRVHAVRRRRWRFGKASASHTPSASRRSKASIMFKRIHGALPSYLNEHISINNSRHSRTTRYSNFNVLCPRYNRETEGGRTFLVTGTEIWNELPLRIRMADSIRCFKHNMWTNIFSQQQFLSHFCV